MDDDVEDLPDGISRDEFCRLYRQHLEAPRQRFVEGLRQLLSRTDFTSPVDDVELAVFPDESGDGQVSVWCYFKGRNTRVSSTEPSLFAGKSLSLSEGIEVPLHDPDAYDFDTADASVAVVMDWVLSCWNEAGGGSYALPATLSGHDDCCGTSEVVPLNAAAEAREKPPSKKRDQGRARSERGK